MAGIPGVCLGKRYKLCLSSAIAGDLFKDKLNNAVDAKNSGTNSRDLVGLQYRFKPPVDESQDALVHVADAEHTPGSQRWHVRFQAGTSSSGMRAAHAEEHFEGAPAKRAGESVMVWRASDTTDALGRVNGIFTIEPIAESVQLIHMGGSGLRESSTAAFHSSSKSALPSVSADALPAGGRAGPIQRSTLQSLQAISSSRVGASNNNNNSNNSMIHNASAQSADSRFKALLGKGKAAGKGKGKAPGKSMLKSGGGSAALTTGDVSGVKVTSKLAKKDSVSLPRPGSTAATATETELHPAETAENDDDQVEKEKEKEKEEEVEERTATEKHHVTNLSSSSLRETGADDTAERTYSRKRPTDSRAAGTAGVDGAVGGRERENEQEQEQEQEDEDLFGTND